jgi:hypothetical protein
VLSILVDSVEALLHHADDTSMPEHDKERSTEEDEFATVPMKDHGMSCQADITSLEPGTDYLLRVYATNDQGSSPASTVGTPPILQSSGSCRMARYLANAGMLPGPDTPCE